jgi:hypothetical protein
MAMSYTGSESPQSFARRRYVVKFSKVFFAVLIVAFATPLAAQMEERWKSEEHRGRHCSLATLKGTYGSFAEGMYLVQIPGTPVPPYSSVAVGLHTFDGKGNWSLTFARSLGGVIIPWGATAAGTYTVTPDCELSVDGKTPQNVPTTFVGPITGEGIFQEVHITYTDRSQVNSGILRKTPPWGCSSKTLEGKYVVFGQGSVASSQGPVPVAHVGVFVADGHGNFSGEETVKIADVTSTDTFSAKYTVNRDCTISAEITNSSQVIHEVGTITGLGEFQEGHLIVTESGWVFADTGRRK